MKKHTMYVEQRIDGYRGQQRVDYYLASEVDARIAELEQALRHIEQASLNSTEAEAKLADIHETASEALA